MVSRCETKIWGTARTLHLTNDLWIVLIHVVSGGFCSEHWHDAMDNMFCLLSGDLSINTFQDGTCCCIKLTTNEVITVPPSTTHRFHSLGGCVAIEIYRPATGKLIDQNDIVRLHSGGILNG